jgi:hypothetical protein
MGPVRGAQHGDRIRKGVLSTTTRSMIEVFLSNQTETAEYRRLLATVFR